MSMKNELKTAPWVSLRKLNGGFNSFDDAQDIEDNQFSDVMNVTFDKGYPTPRKGSQLKWYKPTGETNSLLSLFPARASDGTNYAVACYAPNFYLRDEINDQWVKINSTYTPSATYKALPYGFANWNAGISADVLYMGNGTELAIKWQIAVGYVSTLANAGATSLVLTDATKFPNTGTIVIKTSGGSEVYTTYSAKILNTLTVPALGADVAAGSVVTFQIMSNANVQKGKIFSKYLGRLIVANQLGGEATIYGSAVGNAENFTPATTAVGPFSQVITDGVGGISGLDSFGEYMIAEKDDSMHKIILTTAQDVSGGSYKRIDVMPVLTDISMGPIQPWARVKKNNFLYYATATEGIIMANPDITGSQMSIQTAILSQIIQPTITSLDFSNSRTTAFNQKLLWSCSDNVTSDTIVVYDLLRQIWTKFNGWQVKDWLTHNKKLYFGSAADNGIYECFTDTKMDGEATYDAFCVSKRFDFGQGALPKTANKLFVSGYISPAETIFFDVILMTGDKIVTIPYKISGTGSFAVTSIPKALGMYMLGMFSMGMPKIEIDEVTGFFKAYLAIPSRYGFYTLQIKTYSNVDGTDWGLTGYGFEPWLEQKAPQMMVVGSVSDTTNIN